MGGSRRPEEELVVRCARTEDAPQARLTAVLERPHDWSEVRRLSVTHCVTPLVSATLGRYGSEVVPEETLSTMRERAGAIARRNLRMLQEVAALSSAFEEAGIRAIPYRGPIVAEVAYRNVGAREFGDLDFLVPQADLRAARSILLDRGYERRYVLPRTEGLTDAQERAYVRFARDYPFSHASEPFEVEIHWRVVSQHFPTGIDLDAVWDRRETLSIAGASVPVLSHEDRLLMLCVHGTRHRWERLRWICDVAEYLQRRDFDWEAIRRRAREHHCERMLLLGLAVVDDHFAVPLSDRVRRAIDADPAIDSLRAHVWSRLFDETDYWSLDLRRYQSRTLERYRDKGSFWAHWALKPDRGDIETVALPRALTPLYSGVRWARLARAGAARLTGEKRDERQIAKDQPG